jgi:hypothetical protein
MSNKKLNKIDFLLPEEVHRRALKSISAQKIIDSINQERHLPGKHSQKSHGGGRISSKLTQSVLEKVKANGGLSVNMLSGNEPTGGYMVAKGTNLGDIVSADDFYDETKITGILSDYFKKNKSELSGSDNYLGIWHNTEDGQVYLDVSQNILDRTEAIVAGQTRDQISIWDVVNFEEIGTGGTGDIRTNRHSEDSGHFRNDGSGDRSTINADSKTDLSRKREAAERIIRHLPGKHAQKSHGGGRGGGRVGDIPETKRPYVGHSASGKVPDEQFAAANNKIAESDKALSQTIKKYGYNDKPSVSDQEFNKLKDDGAVVVYRGFSRDVIGGKSPEDMAEQFRDGDEQFVGFGYYGNGTYTSTKLGTAESYGKQWDDTLSPGKGLVTEMAIRPEAKFIDEEDMENLLYNMGEQKQIDYYTEGFTFLDKDPSALAIHLGYDGIKRTDSPGEDHYIILNRSAVVLSQGNIYE